MTAARPVQPYELQSPYLEDSMPPLCNRGRVSRPSRPADLQHHLDGILTVLSSAASVPEADRTHYFASEQMLRGMSFSAQRNPVREALTCSC